MELPQVQSETRSGYAIFINTIAEGWVPLWFDAEGKPCLFATEQEAQREIVDVLIMRLQECLAGERDFEDAITVEEHIVAVTQLPDGALIDEDGRRYGLSR